MEQASPVQFQTFREAPVTAFSYDQPIGRVGRLLFAGELSYGNGLPGGGVATAWMPAGDALDGPVTEIVVRQTWLGPGGLMFRGERFSQRNTFSFGDRAVLHYGADIVSAQMGASTQSFRPVAALTMLLSSSLQASLMVASGTAVNTTTSGPSPDRAMNDLNSFPVLMFRDGRPELEGGLHEEINVRYKLHHHASIEAAAFHDQSKDTPIFGSGNPTSSDYLQDPFSSAFVYDAGSTDSSGVRVAYTQKLGEGFDVAAVYAFAGALAPGSEDISAGESLRDSLNMRYRHSVGARFSGKVRRSGTQFSVGYKWLSGQALTRQDSYGEAIYDLDPYLALVRQPLPGTIMELPLGGSGGGPKSSGARLLPVASQDGRSFWYLRPERFAAG